MENTDLTPSVLDALEREHRAFLLYRAFRNSRAAWFVVCRDEDCPVLNQRTALMDAAFCAWEAV